METASEEIAPLVTETGRISVSIDALGTNSAAGGSIDVDKPTGATVRAAYLAAASTGFTNRQLADDDVSIDSVGVDWDISIPNSIASWNHWAEVTDLVKPKIDGAPAGLVSFDIAEVNTNGIDGEILAVIFDDPMQSQDNTVILLFGAQEVDGDTFAIGLADPIDTSDPNLTLDMSLGISYGAQGTTQFSRVDVNGERLTTSAGGQDDGQFANGALITAGGIGDTNDNPPNPFAFPTDERSDDELYNLIPFVDDGDQMITVFTQNPSDDDNILFAAFLLSETAIVGEGILLSPTDATNPTGTEHTVTATLQDDQGQPIVGRDVDFEITTGPHAGLSGTATTDASGKATFSYTGTVVGEDEIVASFINSQGETVTSNTVTKQWTGETQEGQFVVTVDDPLTDGIDVIVADNSPVGTMTAKGPTTHPDTLAEVGKIIHGSPVGNFPIVNVAAASKPAIGDGEQAEVFLSTTIFGGPGDLIVMASDSDFQLESQTGTYTMISPFGGGTQGTVTFVEHLDLSNTPFSMGPAPGIRSSDFVGPIGPGAFATVRSTEFDFPNDNPFSLTKVITVAHAGTSQFTSVTGGGIVQRSESISTHQTAPVGPGPLHGQSLMVGLGESPDRPSSAALFRYGLSSDFSTSVGDPSAPRQSLLPSRHPNIVVAKATTDSVLNAAAADEVLSRLEAPSLLEQVTSEKEIDGMFRGVGLEWHRLKGSKDLH